jgi:DNA-binding response OmpR family regulator
MSVLVVEDDEAIRELVVLVLQDEGYVVLEAGDGRAGLDAVALGRPSLVLLDMRMPVLSGWDFARVLRERGEAVPIVVMTAARDARAWAAEIGAVGFLAKPFELDELLAAVARWCEP